MVSKKTCYICNKKISIIEEIIAKCKCNNYFCKLHSMPELHNCNIDYINNNKKNLEKKLIKITSNKNIEV
jgi:predicted nucleic acid binding AN1-type Zn finger protein